MINLNNGHTAHSPGAVWGKRTEYRDSRRLISAVAEGLRGLPVKITEGAGGAGTDELLFIFHRSTSEKNSPKTGAGLYVPAEASADTQLRAFRLLSSLCDGSGLRYRGVHTATAECPFGILRRPGDRQVFLIKAGYIDSDADNERWDKSLHGTADALSQEIMRIYKEKINENYS